LKEKIMGIEKLELTVADGSTVLGSFMIPVYHAVHFGREEVQHILEEAQIPIEKGLLDKIHETKFGKNNLVVEEHFIFRRKGDGNYTIEDRNHPPMTYINGSVVKDNPVPIKAGDVIALPLMRNNQMQSFYIQIGFSDEPTVGKEIKQLIQCARTGKKFITYWVEDAETRKHFAIKTEPVTSAEPMRMDEVKNLRPASQTPCHYCSSKFSVYCPKCKVFICFDEGHDKWKCAGCGLTYKTSEMKGSNIDIKTL
jgi:hypothetical protein